jgi:hypothetical protein
MLDMNLRLPADLIVSREVGLLYLIQLNKNENGLQYHRLNGEYNIIHRRGRIIRESSERDRRGGAKMIQSLLKPIAGMKQE